MCAVQKTPHLGAISATKIAALVALTAPIAGCYNLAITSLALVTSEVQKAAVDASIRNSTGTTPGSAVLGPVSSPTAQPNAAVAQWQTYQPPGVPVSIDMPGPATATPQMLRWDTFSVPQTYANTYVAGSGYGLAYAEFPAGYVAGKDPAAILDRRRDGTLAASKGTLLSEEPWSLGSAVGRTVRIRMQTGRVGIVRMALYERWLLQAIYEGASGTESSADAQRFLASFKPGVPNN